MPITLDGTLGITTPALTVTGATVNTGGISTAGNLTFTSTGQRITGDFNNSTFANRTLFQGSVTNGGSALGVIPNGTSPSASLQLFNNSDPTNASRAIFSISASDAQINSTITGTGTYLPLTFYTNASERMRIDTSGNAMVGVTTALGRFSVAGGTYQLSLHDGNGSSSSFGYLNYGGSTGAMILNAYSTGGSTYQAFYTSNAGTNAERMRLDNAGNLGIGVTPSYKLQVGTTVAATTGVQNISYLTVQSSGLTDSGFGARLLLGTQNANGNVWPAGIAALNSSAGSNLSELGFYTATSGPTFVERMRINSAGDVGIGIADPGGFRLNVFHNDNSAVKSMNLRNFSGGSGAYTLMYIGNDTSNTCGLIGVQSSTNTANYGGANSLILGTNQAAPVVIITQGVERFRVNNSGTVSLQGASTATTGVGITFPATQSASSDANTLDDYEEGTFTPTIITTGTAFSNSQGGAGQYTKIGNLVTVRGNLNLNGATSGGTGNARMGGLPFTVNGTTGYDAYGVWSPGRITLSGTYGYVMNALGATTTAAIYNLQNAANANELPASALNGNTTPYWSFTFSYIVA